MSGRSSGSASCAAVGVASRLCEPSSLMISFTRGNQIGSDARAAHEAAAGAGPHAARPLARLGLGRATAARVSSA